MSTILYPTDFSEHAEVALEHALSIAKARGSKLLLLNAFDVDYVYHDLPKETYRMKNDESMEALKKIEANIKESSDYGALEIECVAAYGHPIEMISEEAKKRDIELIVMGTKGRTGIMSSIFGSNAYKVLKDVTVPVMFVPKTATNAMIEEILFSSDYSNTPESNLKYIGDVARSFGAKITVLNVQKPGELGTVDDAAEVVRQDAVFGEDVKHDFEFTNDKDIMAGVDRYIEEKNPDVLVMIHHERRDWLEALAKQNHVKAVVMSDLRIPTIVLKDF